jgi:hypothetical protein
VVSIGVATRLGRANNQVFARGDAWGTCLALGATKNANSTEYDNVSLATTTDNDTMGPKAHECGNPCDENDFQDAANVHRGSNGTQSTQ